MHRRGLGMASWAPVDVALWDIAGKQAGVPVYKLPGTQRYETEVYATYPPRNESSEGYVREAKELQDQGFRAYKIHPGLMSTRDAIETVQRVRATVGDDMRLYHKTYATEEILAEGFRNGHGHYMTDREWSGVWFSDRPLDSNEGAVGDTVLRIEIPIRRIREYEWIEEGKGYREFLIPAETANEYGPPVVHSVDETQPLWKPT